MSRQLVVLFLAATCLVATGCGNTYRMRDSQPDRDWNSNDWSFILPAVATQSTYRVDATFPMGRQSSFLSFLELHPDDSRFRHVAMTVEGLTMLDASWTDGNIVVHHAIPPFDDMNVSHSMMSDIAAVFLPPLPGTAHHADMQVVLIRGWPSDGGVLLEATDNTSLSMTRFNEVTGTKVEGIYSKDDKRLREVLWYADTPNLPKRARVETTAGKYKLKLELTRIESAVLDE